MIFTAAILICEISTPKTFDTCMILSNVNRFRTEAQCMSSIADVLNDDLFKYAYANYELEEYACHPWLQTKA